MTTINELINEYSLLKDNVLNCYNILKSKVQGSNIDNAKMIDIIRRIPKLEEENPKEIWVFTGHTRDVNSVAVDNQGNVYSGSGDYTVRKISTDGNEIWMFPVSGWPAYSVAVDNQGNVYSGIYGKVTKINADGNKIWEFSEYRGDVNSVAVDNEGNVYSGSGDYTVRKISTDGNEIWNYESNESVRCVATGNKDDICYIRGNYIEKIDSNGNTIWTNKSGYSTLKSVAVDYQGNCYTASVDNIVRKTNPQGNEMWMFKGHSDDVNSVAVDNQGNVYSGSKDCTIRKVNPYTTFYKTKEIC